VSAVAFDILGIGTTAVDDFIHVAHYPPADVHCPMTGQSRALGGLVGTALATAAKLGARCAYAGILGEGDLSAAVRRGFEAVGVDCRQVMNRVGTGPCHSIIIVDDATQTRNIFFDLALSQPLPSAAVTRDLIASARVLFIDQFGIAAKIKAAKLAREFGVPVVADLEWPKHEGTAELLALVEHVIMPLHFAVALAGERDPARAVSRLHARCPRACTAVTCGADGCYFLVGADAGGVRHQPAPAVKAVETTGCGDVFHGAYASAVAAGHNAAECIRWAAAAAAVYASRPSGWDHLPTAADTAALLKHE
jgi:sulfofructose kinase